MDFIMQNSLKSKTLFVLLISILMLTACGQKFALYLPEEPQSNNTSGPSEKPVESATQKQD
jgi:predicted small lipoprotein YifL